MGNCDCIPLFPLLMLPLILLVINSDSEPISPEQQAMRDENWRKAQENFSNDVRSVKEPLALLGGLTVMGIVYKTWRSNKSTASFFIVIAVLGGLFLFSTNTLTFDGFLNYDIETCQIYNTECDPVADTGNQEYYGHLGGMYG